MGIIMYTNVFYFLKINDIGGIETFYYNLAKKYTDRDITIVYRVGARDQIRRLQKLVRVIHWEGQRIQCKRAFFNYNLDIIDYIDAEEYIQIMHGDYRAMGILPNYSPKITKYLACSKIAAEAFHEITGQPVKTVYNPVAEPPKEKALRLISATRLTREKGKERIERLARILDAAGVVYTWEIFTDNKDEIQNENIIYRKPTMNIGPYIAAADWLVQLSDNEGYCYSVVEALQAGTPVIVTPCPVFAEIGVNEKNSITLPFDFNDAPIEQIKAGLPPFEYKPKKDGWSALLGKEKSSYTYERHAKARTTVVKKYFDLVLNRNMNCLEELTMDRDRAEHLENMGLIRILD